jgi:hypothetical protein
MCCVLGGPASDAERVPNLGIFTSGNRYLQCAAVSGDSLAKNG